MGKIFHIHRYFPKGSYSVLLSSFVTMRSESYLLVILACGKDTVQCCVYVVFVLRAICNVGYIVPMPCFGTLVFLLGFIWNSKSRERHKSL